MKNCFIDWPGVLEQGILPICILLHCRKLCIHTLERYIDMFYHLTNRCEEVLKLKSNCYDIYTVDSTIYYNPIVILLNYFHL